MGEIKNQVKKSITALQNLKNIVKSRIVFQNIIKSRRNLRKNILIPRRNLRKNISIPIRNIHKIKMNIQNLKSKPKSNIIKTKPKPNIQKLIQKPKPKVNKQIIKQNKQIIKQNKQIIKQNKQIVRPNIPKVKENKQIVRPNKQNVKKNIPNSNYIKSNLLQSVNKVKITDKLFPFIEKVIYINLEERKDRKKVLLEQLIHFPDDKIIRFNAIKETPGYIGCTKSHIAALEMAIENNWSNCLIVEDDMIWSNFNRGYRILENLVKSPYDVISLGSTSAKFNKDTYKLIKGKTTTCYLVNNHYYSTLLQNFKEGLQNLNNGGSYCEYALDEYWELLQKTDNWYLVTPALTIQSAGFSDIENKRVNYEKWFY